MGNTPSDLQGRSTTASPSVRRSPVSTDSNRRDDEKPPAYTNFFEAAAVSSVPPPSPRPRMKRKAREDSCTTVSTTSTLSNTAQSQHAQKPLPTGPFRMPSESSTTSTLVQPDASLSDKTACSSTELDDDMHSLLKRVLGGLYKAPVHKILSSCENLCHRRPHVLEIGCGQGSWIMEMASKFPKADFCGIDACMPAIPPNFKLKNAHFKVHQCRENQLAFADHSFDYIHMRMLLCRLTHSEWIRLLGEMVRVLKPGGYLEMVDLDYTVQRAGSRCNDLVNQQVLEMMRKEHQIDLQRARYLPAWLQADLVDIQQDRAVVPLGWGNADNAVVESLFAQIDVAPPGCQKHQPHCVVYACHGRKPTNTLDDTWDSMVHDFASGYID